MLNTFVRCINSHFTILRRTNMPGHLILRVLFFIVLMISLILPFAVAEDPCSVAVDSIPEGGHIFIDGIRFADTPSGDIAVTPGTTASLLQTSSAFPIRRR